MHDAGCKDNPLRPAEVIIKKCSLDFKIVFLKILSSIPADVSLIQTQSRYAAVMGRFHSTALILPKAEDAWAYSRILSADGLIPELAILSIDCHSSSKDFRDCPRRGLSLRLTLKFDTACVTMGRKRKSIPPTGESARSGLTAGGAFLAGDPAEGGAPSSAKIEPSPFFLFLSYFFDKNYY